jgi:uncharacterized protein (TIGR00251 family)
VASRRGRRQPADALGRADSRTQAAEVAREWARQAGSDTLLLVHVRPGAKTAAVVAEFGGRLKIAIDAPPVDGKANEALVAYLARVLGRARSRLQIQSGGTHRDKCVRIEEAQATEIVRLLLALISASSK